MLNTISVPAPVTGALSKPAVSGFVTEKEAAAALSISITTMRRWRRNGTGPKCMQIGDIIRYSRAELDAFIQAHSN